MLEIVWGFRALRRGPIKIKVSVAHDLCLSSLSLQNMWCLPDET